MNNFQILLLTIIGLTFITSCNKDEEEIQQTNEVKPIQIMGNVEIPDNVPSNKIGTLQILSGCYLNSVTDNPQKLNNRMSNDNKYCKIETLPNSVQLHTILNNDKPFMYGLTINANVGDQISFNEESTTIGLVFMHPLIIVSEPTKATLIVEKIKNAPSFTNLKNEIKSILANGSLNNITPFINVDNLTNYKYVVVETLNQLNDNSAIEQNGLQIIENLKVGNEIRFKIRNYKKRFSTIYAHKYNGGQLTNTDIKLVNGNLGYGPFEWVSAGEFDWIDAWISIFNLQPKDQITKDSELFTVNAENAEKIYIKCYGLGIADGGFPAFESEDFNRGALALAYTSVFDIIIPTVEVITGVKDIAKSGDLRGRPNDDPLKKLINRYLERFKSSISFHSALMNAAISNDKQEVFKEFYSETKDFLLDEENTKLYLDIVKQKANLSNAALSTFKSSLSKYSMFKTAGDITGTSVNLAEAVYATFSTKWTTEFRINVDGTLTPTDGLVAYYPFNGNANDESGNGNNGTVNGATLTADRHGNANKAYSFDGIDDLIRVENSNSLQNFGNYSTISAWVFANNYSVTVSEIIPILAKSASNNSPNQFRLGYDKGVNQLYSSFNGAGYGASCPTILLNSWYHIVFVRNGNQSCFFINGVKYIISGTGNSTFDSSQPLIIGQDIEGLNEILNGKVDDIRIYNNALTDSEVQTLFNE